MLKIGSIVKSITGHDADRFYVVVKLDETYAYIADGKRRKLQKPKPKKHKHIAPTNHVVDMHGLDNDCKIRKALWEFNYPNEQ